MNLVRFRKAAPVLLALSLLASSAGSGTTPPGGPPASAELRGENDFWRGWPVRSVRTVGLTDTDSTVLLRELELLPGAPYSDESLDEDANAVKNTLLFARIVVNVSPDSSTRCVDIVYAVNERPRYLPYPIVGSTDKLDWILGAGLVNLNLAGTGRKFYAEAEFGGRRAYILQFEEPWFFGRRRPFSARVKYSRKENVDGAYTKITREASIGLRHYFDRAFSIGAFPYYFTLRTTEDPAGGVTVNPSGRDVVAGVLIGLDLNTTDVHIKPRRGWHLLGDVSIFGSTGRDQPAGTQVDAGVSRFFGLPAGAVLGLNLAAGATVGRRGDYMKRYLGGAKGVRPGAGDDWPGWSTAQGSAEFRVPLLERRLVFRRIDLGLDGVLFADAGSSWRKVFSGDGVIHGGGGAGLRIYAPFVDVVGADAAWSPGKGFVIHIYKGQHF